MTTSCPKIITFVSNPSLITNKNLEELKLDVKYCSALCQSLISLGGGILIYQEPIVGSESYAHVLMVSSTFCNIIFVAFHANPIGANLNAYRTLHCIHLHFQWPGMYSLHHKNVLCLPRLCLVEPY
jgi:hypothetical protein